MLDATPDGTIPSADNRYSPVSDTSFLQKTAAGAGKFLTDLGQGAQQIAGFASPQDVLAKRAMDAPLMATAGGKVGQVAGGVMSAIPLALIPGVNTYAGAAALGGSYGALNPVAGNESRALNTGIGAGLGVAGQYAGNVLGRWLANRQGPVPAGLTATQQAAADSGTDLGMQLTPGQASGNRALQQFESKLESNPFTSGPFNKIKANNQEVLNSATASAIGESSPVLDANVLSQAHDRMSQVFESARDPNSIIVTDPAATSAILDSIDHEGAGLLPASIRSNPLVTNLEGLTSQGSINGEQLGKLSSKLGKAAYKQMSSPAGDRDMGQALYAVKDHVDDLLESSLSGDAQAEYAAVRGQYRNFKNITSNTRIVNPSSGNVSGVSLANKLQQKDVSGFLLGGNQSDMYNAARFAQAFKPIVGDSGTATRSWRLLDLPFALPMNLASRAYLSAPGGAAIRGIAATSNAIGQGAAAGSRAIAPYAAAGLPGLSGSLIPYLTE